MTTTPYSIARKGILDGDTALVRNDGPIQWTQREKWTHAEKCKWDRDENGKPGELMLYGSREFEGVRGVTLHSQVIRFPGKIDIFRLKDATPAQAYMSARMVVKQSGHKYGWWSSIWQFFSRLSGLRLLLGYLALLPVIGRLLKPLNYTLSADSLDYRAGWYAQKNCSQTVIWADRMVGIDPCPRRPDMTVLPGDLGTSAAYDLVYEGLIHA